MITCIISVIKFYPQCGMFFIEDFVLLNVFLFCSQSN
jgi:hypothetical protein